MIRPLLSLLALSFVLTGCAAFKEPEPTIIYRTRLVMVDINPMFYQTKPIPQPPGKALYMKSPLSEREGLLTIYSTQLMGALASCQNDKISIDGQIQEQRALIEQQGENP